MNDRFQTADLAELFEPRADGPHVTIYLPTHRTHPASAQDPIRFRNLLEDARGTLAAGETRAPEVAAILQPGSDLLDDAEFWNHQRGGLAVFLSEGWSRIHRVASTLPELVKVGPRFHVKPLLPSLLAGARFYVLTISQNEVELFEGSRDGLVPVEVPEAPKDMADALRYDDLERQDQLHVAGGGPPIVHGHGVGDEVDKVLVERFLRAVDEGLWPIVRDDDAPMVLAGVGYEQAIFRSVTRYRHVLDAGIDGNPEGLDHTTLHERASEIVAPLFERERDVAEGRYLEAAGRGDPVAADVAEVAKLASEARVDTLFVPIGEQRWGSVDPQTLEVSINDEDGIDEVDLLDLAAVRTLMSSGTVYAVAPEDVPGPGPAAALLRY